MHRLIKYSLKEYIRNNTDNYTRQYNIADVSPKFATKEKYSLEQPSVSIKRLRSIIIGPKNVEGTL